MTKNATQPQATTTGSTFADLDPRTLTIEANVRTDVNLKPEFVESIRDNGVLMPILVQQHEDGTLHVRAGQRRTLAAIAADQATIPARIVTGSDDDAERIIQQMIENDDREGLTTAERAAGYQQMSLMGVSAASIARRLHKPKAEVEAGITVAASQAGIDAANDGLNLIDAAIFAEFEGDEEATNRLRDAVWHGSPVAHAAQRIRDQRAEQAKVDALRQALSDANVTIRRAPGYYDNLAKPLTDLHTKGSKDPLTAEEHATCPGHVAWITTSGDEPEIVYGCEDYRAHGHMRATAPSAPSTPMSEEDRAARREVIANNKAWRSAETVRRAWLATFAKRKTAPKGAAAFVARVLIDGYKIDQSRQQGHRLAHDLLGVQRATGWHSTEDPFGSQLATATPARAQHIALVISLAAVEESTQTGTWRHAYGVTRDYFAFLKDSGYDLSEVEAMCLPGATAEVQDDEETDDADDEEADEQVDD